MHEGEIRCKAAVARERNTDEHSRGRDLHADERGQTPSDGDGPSAHKSPKSDRSLIYFL